MCLRSARLRSRTRPLPAAAALALTLTLALTLSLAARNRNLTAILLRFRNRYGHLEDAIFKVGSRIFYIGPVRQRNKPVELAVNSFGPPNSAFFACVLLLPFPLNHQAVGRGLHPDVVFG